MVLPWTEEDEEEPQAEQPTILARSFSDYAEEIEGIEALIRDAREEAPFLKCAFYGPPGAGKTTLGASFPDCLILDCREDGTKFIRRQGVKVIKANSMRVIEATYWYLKNKPHPFKTIVIDTVTSMADMCLDYVLREDVEWEVRVDPNLPSQRHWQKVGRILGLVLMAFKDLDMHVVFLANERRQESMDADVMDDDDDDSPSIFPELSPSVRSKLYRAVDIMGRLTVRERVQQGENGEEKKTISRILRCKTNGLFQAKDRNGRLPSMIQSPNYDKINGYILKESN